MTRKARVLVPLITVGLLLISPLNAQDKKYRFEVFGGASLPLDKDFLVGAPQTTVEVEGTHQFSVGPQVGARIGVDGHRHWGMDYAYSYGQNDSKVVTPYGSFSIKNGIHHASSNVLFYPFSLEARSVFPYVTAGVGATFVAVDQETITQSLNPLRAGIGTIDGEVIFAFNAGGGVRIRMSERFGVRIDLRDYMSRPFRYGLPESSSDPDAAVLPTSGVFHQFAGTFGIVIHF